VTPWLAGFSDWTLALLPRLFLYPGGLWALLALVLLRLASGGPSTLKPRMMVESLWDFGFWILDFGVIRNPKSKIQNPNYVAAATAWAALALLPLPGAVPLPSPADRFSLAALLVTSLALDWHSGEQQDVAHASTGIAITLALVAPLAQADVGTHIGVPLQSGAYWGVSGWLSLAAVCVGLCLLSTATAYNLAGALRWLAWLGLAVAPLWAVSAELPLPGIYWVSLTYALFIVGLAALGNLVAPRMSSRVLLAICWGLAALSLLAALLP